MQRPQAPAISGPIFGDYSSPKNMCRKVRKVGSLWSSMEVNIILQKDKMIIHIFLLTIHDLNMH